MDKKHNPIRSATVRPHLGQPTLMVNGEPTSGLTYMTYNFKPENFTAFDQLGARIMSFTATSDSHVWPHMMPPVCTGPGRYDYTSFDERLRAVAEAAPQSWLLPRVYTLPPPWWCEQNPDECVRFGRPQATPNPSPEVASGQPVPSFASKVWREFAADNLARLVRHVQAGPWADRMLGYHVATGITEEWIWWGASSGHFADYSPAMQRAFREFLTQQYGTDEVLQAAWKRKDVTLSSAEVPSLERRIQIGGHQIRNVTTHQDVADYILCHSDVVAQTLCHFAGAVKAALTEPRLVIAFYGYMANFGHQAYMCHNAGHLALARVLECPDIDGLTSPSSYTHRGIDDGYSSFMAPVESVALHGKYWFDENDYYTHLPKYRPAFGATRTPEDTICANRRQFAASLEHRVGMWWFDMTGDWYDAGMYDEARQSVALEARALQLDCANVAEVALIWDPKSVAYMTGEAAVHYALGSAPLASFGRSGAPFDMLLLSDLPKARPYRLYVFLNAIHLSSGERRMIEQIIQREGRTALWVYAAGYLGQEPTGLPAHSATTGMKTLAYGNHVVPSTVVSEGNHPITSGLGAPRTYGTDAWLMRPMMFLDDPEATPLGFWTADEQMPLLAARDFGAWRSVWSCAPNLPPWLTRRVARWAGVHVYSETDGPLYVNKSFLSISTGAAGPRRISLPRQTSVYEVFAPHREWTDVSEFTVEMPRHHTSIFFLGTKEAWDKLGVSEKLPV